MSIVLRSYQEHLLSGIFNAWGGGHNAVVAVSPTGCHAPGTQILMYDGTLKSVENVQVGDRLMGPDSQPRTVLRTISGNEPMYRISPVRGDSFVVNENHVLSLMTTNEGKKHGVKAGGIVNISVKEYLTKSKYYKHVHKLWRTGVDFPSGSDLPMPPYVVGALLGDGSFSQGTPNLTGMDSEIHDEITEYAKSIGIIPRVSYREGNRAWQTHFGGVPGKKNNFTEKLIEIGIFGRCAGDKFVPHQYLTASRTDRLEIIAGLMDSDGHMSRNGYDFISKSLQLAKDLTFLCRSVGLRVNLAACVKGSQTGRKAIYYRVHVSGNTEIVPNRVPRQKAFPRRQIKNSLVSGFKVESIGNGDFYGFTLDGDNLYLTEDFVVHHNSGKAFTLAEAVKRNAEPTCVMVHRGELVAQLSETLATLGITHRVIASKSTVAMCAARHVRKFGRSFIHPQSPVGVASVQTLVRRGDKIKQWSQEVKLVVADECHHYLADNQFGTAVAMFPNAKLLGVTATPDRTDRKSLAKVQKTGLFDILIEGPTPRWLIDQGYLSPYKLIAPPPSIHMDETDISAGTGEFKAATVRKKSHESRIVGDVVETWKRFGEGRQTIVFTVDVETSNEVAKAFNDAGVRAASVSGKTPDSLRNALVDKFTNGQITVRSTCDLFSEGFDVPGATCAILARPTISLGMYRQQVGRVLRTVYKDNIDLSSKESRISAIADGPKPYAIVIDHVENFKRHGLLDADRKWSLIRPEGSARSKNRDDEIPLKSCVNDGCWKVYPATLSACPHCGHKPEPLSRGSIEHVEGDLIEYSPELLAKLRGEIARVDGAPQVPHGASEIVRRSIEKRWRERSEAQKRLRDTIALWAGVWRDKGATDSESYRRFYFTFGTDVLSAQALGATEADTLRERVEADCGIVTVDTAQQAVITQEDCKTLDDWKRLAEQEGYAPMWADYMYERSKAT